MLLIEFQAQGWEEKWEEVLKWLILGLRKIKEMKKRKKNQREELGCLKSAEK